MDLTFLKQKDVGFYRIQLLITEPRSKTFIDFGAPGNSNSHLINRYICVTVGEPSLADGPAVALKKHYVTDVALSKCYAVGIELEIAAWKTCLSPDLEKLTITLMAVF